MRIKGHQLECGDCLEVMKGLPDKSMDMVLCDLPYGYTRCEWDYQINLEELWEQYRRVLRLDGAIVLTSSHPFTHTLISSNLSGYRYSWVWDKKFPANFVQAKRTPLKTHEDVLVFSNNNRTPRYFPVMVDRDVPIKKGGNKQSKAIPIMVTENSKKFGESGKVYTQKFPTTILTFSSRDGRGLHPTQKPVALFEYLIRTYTNPGDTVLDNCCGSGTTGVACVNTGRLSIQIELSPDYYDIAQDRLLQALHQRKETRS